MKVDDLNAIRQGAELQNLKPYMDTEIGGMQKAVVSFVLSAVNKGELTPDMALSKWVEYIAYFKLSQKIDQRIRVGQSIGAENEVHLDIKIK